MNLYVQNNQEELNKATEYFKKDISSLRTGRANASVLDNVFVDAYEAKNPLSSVASISVADARCLLIAPWDKSISKNIEKALVEADLGLSIVNEGDKIRATVPMMTEENRRDLVKTLNEKTEKAKVSIRQLRDEIKASIEEAAGAKEFGEDDKFRYIREMEDVIAKKNDEIKEIRDKKEKDIMTI